MLDRAGLVAVLVAVGAQAQGRQPPDTPLRIAVAAADTTYPPRDMAFLALVRRELTHRTTPAQLSVVSQRDWRSTGEQGGPEPSSHQDYREYAKLLRADVVVDIALTVRGTEVATRAVAHYPTAAPPDTLPTIRGATDSAVAGKLAVQLLDRTLRGVHERRFARLSGFAEVVSAPNESYLLDITREWSHRSPLGDLRQRKTGPADVEVRAWGGYGLTGTSGVVLRRENGRWRAWRAQQVRCALNVAIPIADTASQATRAAYVDRARRRCNVSVGDVSRGALIFDADTIAVSELSVPRPTIERAWDAAVKEGLLNLPPRVPGRGGMLDGFTYAIEVRQGAKYRASVIEQVDKPEFPADAQVKRVFEELLRVVPNRP